MGAFWTWILQAVLAVTLVSGRHGRGGLGKEKVFEGDISLSKKEFRKMDMEMAISGGTSMKMWDNGVIPYVISDGFSEDQRDMILKAMEEISGDTCIKFTPREGEADFLHFQLGGRCSSKVGRMGGDQRVLMDPKTCMKIGTVVHELFHALGFWHEQSRPDRDKYVFIKQNNIKPDRTSNFKTYETPLTRTYELPYDYASIMHYSGFAFQKESGLQTIVPKIPNAPIGLRTSMSYFDKMKVNLAYKCDELL